MNAIKPAIAAPAGSAAQDGTPEMRRPDRDRIGADAEEAGMPEADLAGEAHQQVQAKNSRVQK